MWSGRRTNAVLLTGGQLVIHKHFSHQRTPTKVFVGDWVVFRNHTNQLGNHPNQRQIEQTPTKINHTNELPQPTANFLDFVGVFLLEFVGVGFFRWCDFTFVGIWCSLVLFSVCWSFLRLVGVFSCFNQINLFTVSK